MAEEKIEEIFDDGKMSEYHEFVNPEDLYQELIQRVHKYHPSDDISMIEKAYRTAAEAHKDQFRKSGEPYIIHPLNVAIVLRLQRSRSQCPKRNVRPQHRTQSPQARFRTPNPQFHGIFRILTIKSKFQNHKTRNQK